MNISTRQKFLKAMIAVGIMTLIGAGESLVTGKTYWSGVEIEGTQVKIFGLVQLVCGILAILCGFFQVSGGKRN